jgi:hypothetical protein
MQTTITTKTSFIANHDLIKTVYYLHMETWRINENNNSGNRYMYIWETTYERHHVNNVRKENNSNKFCWDD